ncbi:MAG: hypothetical protein FH748_07970 [Balneolaceae bacterium]|nr:hypothetical protein [Balneolaceae bacterium]
MNAIKLLSRTEMKNVMGGQVSECNYSGCSGASAVFNCWYADCAAFYSGQDAIDCSNEVGESWKRVIARCGTNYS